MPLRATASGIFDFRCVDTSAPLLLLCFRRKLLAPHRAAAQIKNFKAANGDQSSGGSRSCGGAAHRPRGLVLSGLGRLRVSLAARQRIP